MKRSTKLAIADLAWMWLFAWIINLVPDKAALWPNLPLWITAIGGFCWITVELMAAAEEGD